MSDTLTFDDFDGYLDALRESRRPVRLLLLFLETRSAEDGDDPGDDRVEVAMATDLPLTRELNFRQVAEKAKTVTWEYLLAGVLGNPDGSMPSAEEAEGHLQSLCLVVSGEGEGDLSGCTAFDHGGRRLPAN